MLAFNFIVNLETEFPLFSTELHLHFPSIYNEKIKLLTCHTAVHLVAGFVTIPTQKPLFWSFWKFMDREENCPEDSGEDSSAINEFPGDIIQHSLFLSFLYLHVK